MTIKEKRKKLQEFCDGRKHCYDCPIVDFNTNMFECLFEKFTDNCICEAYAIICENCKHFDVDEAEKLLKGNKNE